MKPVPSSAFGIGGGDSDDHNGSICGTVVIDEDQGRDHETAEVQSSVFWTEAVDWDAETSEDNGQSWEQVTNQATRMYADSC